MREIKFRAWYNNKSMLYSNSYINLYFFFELQPEKYPLMQYTGLKDKNGKEIYEFDYVLDKHNQRILVEYEFSLLSRLKDIQKELILDGNYYE